MPPVGTRRRMSRGRRWSRGDHRSTSRRRRSPPPPCGPRSRARRSRQGSRAGRRTRTTPSAWGG
ncbi:hypothetical protein [Ornithinimicrobium kibberense]|uniref:hypothetical protein n=1 Tax=Ornithinimicrobium kibberense TaxID=282060 RepID=UPI0036120AB8